MQTESLRKVLSGRAQTPVILIGLLAVLILNNGLWLRLDHTPLTWDEAHHLASSVDYYRWVWGSPSERALKFYEISPYPPLVGLLTHLVFPFCGFNADAAVLFINSLFAAILMLALFGIAHSLCHDRDASLIASLLVFLYPITFVAARHYLLDLPLAALSALSMLLLFRARGFWSLRDSLLLGLTLGLGMLTKWTFAFYLAIPTLMVTLKLFSANPSKRQVIHASLAFTLALLVAALWYVPKFFSLWSQISWHYTWSTHRDDLLWTQRGGLLFYLVNLIFYQVSPLGFIFFLLGLFLFLKKGGSLEKRLIVAWVIAPAIILTLIRYKSPRYALPYLPAIALITVIGLYEIKRELLRISILLTFIILLVAQYYALSFRLFPSPEVGHVKLFQPEYVENFSTSPRNQDWKLDEVLEQLTKAFKRFPVGNREVFVLSYHEVYNANTLNYLSKTKNLGIRFIGAEYKEEPIQVAVSEDTAYVLLKESSPADFFDGNRERVLQATRLIRSQPSRYVPIYSQYLPDGSLVTIYGKSNY